MKRVIKGKAWKFGDNVDRDSGLFPFQYVLESLGGVPLEKLARHVLESMNPEFGVKVEKGDFLVAGKNFGHGKAHKEGIRCLISLGVGGLIADSINKSFIRDALYFGLPMLIGEGISAQIDQGDELAVNMETGEIKNLSAGQTLKAAPAIPRGHPLFPIMQAGGQVEYVKKKVAGLKNARSSMP
jgi:3-isopropylmalate/(R)-2-methylmalate dehydratase small subunit